MSYRIFLDDNLYVEIKAGKDVILELPHKDTIALKVSMKGNSFNLHKIEKEVVVFPEYSKSGVIECVISTKMNWFGFISIGILQSIERIIVDLKY